LKPLLEPVGLECFLALAVVERVVGIKPVALGIHGEIGDFGELGRLD